MPPPGYEPFFRAICENPADDAPRLVYADWLDENGDPDRAEFIRIEIDRAEARARGEEPDDADGRHAELRRISDTRRLELPMLSGIEWQRYWRGFVSGIGVQHWKWFRAHADKAFAATPVQFLSVFGINDRAVAELTRSPYLPRLSGLTLREPAAGMSQSDWYRLLECKGFIDLRHLVILGPTPPSSFPRRRWFDPATIDEPVVRLICASPLADQLERLVIRNVVTKENWDILEARFGRRLKSSV